MESILNSTKKVLGLNEGYTAFDQDVVTHINAAFSVLNQLGVGPADGFYIADEAPVWADLEVPDNQLNLIKTYIYLKVRYLFDPPGTSFHLSAMQKQIEEFEWRLNVARELVLPPVVVPEEV